MRRHRTYLVILVLAVFEHRAQAFTIQRIEADPPEDLTATEGYSLLVRGALKHTIRPIEVSNDTQLHVVTAGTIAKSKETKDDVIKNVIPANKTAEISINAPATEENSLTDITSTFETMTDVTQETNTIESTVTFAVIDEAMKLNSSHPAENVTDERLASTTESLDMTEKYTTFSPADSLNNVNITSESRITNEMPIQQVSELSITNSDLVSTTTFEIGTQTEENSVTGYFTKAVKLPESTDIVTNTNNYVDRYTVTGRDTTTVDAESDIATSMSTETETVLISVVTEENNVNKTGEIATTEAINGSDVPAVPYWKKYKTIFRKRAKAKTNILNDTKSDDNKTYMERNEIEKDNVSKAVYETVNETELATTSPENDKEIRAKDSLAASANNNKSVSEVGNVTLKMESDNSENVTENIQSTEEDNTKDVILSTTPYRETISNTTDNITYLKHVDLDLEQSSTAQTQTISLEKAFSIASEIPSLNKLKNGLLELNTTSNTTEKQEMIETSEVPSTLASSNISSTSNSTVPLETTTAALNSISSKRAGYLDFSLRTVEAISSTQPSKYATQNSSGSSYQPPTTKLSNNMASQSQLVDDAINEELLKEEYLSDSAENAFRQKEEKLANVTTMKNTVLPIPRDSTFFEDDLRVQPISTDKKNGSLYTVSPNYKPLKKLEIQPPKPFVRNPDDNSWRNESLSSLGIVFKAKNSSKPFTQVLKNKTESEWNTLLEKYSKDEGPSELRERLEKIAEIRKNKKKKISQFGETVYTDYEESTEENKNTVKSESFVDKPAQSDNYRKPFLEEMIYEKTTNVYGLSGQETITNTPKKKNEDYEEEDDEMDYTLPNIDLKKFLTSTVEAPALMPVNTPIQQSYTSVHPVPLTYRPDRRPTVQYFPPRDKENKDFISNYDTVFQLDEFTYTPSTPTPTTSTPGTTFKDKYEEQSRITDIPTMGGPEQKDSTQKQKKPVYTSENQNPHSNDNHEVLGYNHDSHAIKHLRDLIDGMVKVDELSSAEDVVSDGKRKNGRPQTDYYDYDAVFRKTVLDKFAENYNQNSDRFKVDFPVLYNTTVRHTQPGLGLGGGESTAFMKRLYEDVRLFQHGRDAYKRCDPPCEHTIELSPEYELHYYVPEEEEKQEIEFRLPKPTQYIPHRLRL